MTEHGLASLLDGTPYVATKRIGRGSMGEVVEAQHKALGSRVVIKVLHGTYSGRADMEDRLRIEAQALSRLRHDNLVPVHDLGRTSAGRAYMVMDRLEGRTLGAEVRARGALPPREAAEIVSQVLAGLANAHALGLVHRDIKLDNLFVCDSVGGGRRIVKVLDFGIAKVVSEVGGIAPLLDPTAQGTTVGTPRYLSPEQVVGKAVDARSDVYATGVVLYHLLAGRGPFDHLDSVIDIMKAHFSTVPSPPSAYAPHPIPAALEQATMRALAKAPDDRFGSAQEFADELDRIAVTLPAAPAADPAPPMGDAEPDAPTAIGASSPAPTSGAWQPRGVSSSPGSSSQPSTSQPSTSQPSVSQPSTSNRWLMTERMAPEDAAEVANARAAAATVRAATAPSPPARRLSPGVAATLVLLVAALAAIAYLALLR